jgi:GT2 family glycosyltransferase
MYNPAAMSPRPLPADIIIPVYRNLSATRRCIDSVLGSEPGPRGKIIVIDDATPEPELREFCQSLAEQPDCVVMHNTDNLGFVATVNRGIAASRGNDIVLLNSDTEVANDWLQRMQSGAYSEDNIGTVTPLSNNASVCSYPVPMKPNPLPDGWTLEQLDALASAANGGATLDLPTAVGFCMYIRRACIDAIGVFDVENFGIGYGEECDFSMRARAAGWRNVLTPDVFVYHEGGQSFSGQTEARIRSAETTLQRIHPEYHVLATRFIDEDPVRPFRDALDRARLDARQADAPAIISALKTHRDAVIDSRTNREMALEHALGELRVRCEELTRECDELSSNLKISEDRLSELDEAYDVTSRELTRLQEREQRWKYLMYLVNRMDGLRFRLAGKRAR